MMDLHDIATVSLKRAKEADHAEVYAVKSFTRCAYIDGSGISNIETKTDIGMCVRVSSDDRPGRACVTLSDENSAENCVNSAMRISSFSPKSAFKGYPMPSKPSVKVNGIVDKNIENAADSELKDLLSSVIGSCGSEIPRGSLRLSVIESVVANSNGLLTEHKSTMMYGHFTSMFRGARNGEGTVSVHGVNLGMDPERVGEELDGKARASASATPFKGTEKITMILPPCELGDMMMSSAGSALNGENVLYKRSPWSDKINTEVASRSLTMVDDPTVPGPLCSAFDDEGFPSRKKTLIDKGVLRSFVRDGFTGDSTGNGMRRNSTDAQNIYNSAVTAKPMNMIVSPGKYSIDEITAQTDNGILVEKFAWPEADPLTGRFGLEVRCGYMVRKGKIAGTVNNALLTGNMIDMLGNIEFIGSDLKNLGCVTVPTMSFSGAELVGN